ncbi:MAG: glycosyltransferase [Elusimicrobia bacterium]|nr:glycosyltransferase [Elusimicrobiota bacterium]
MKILLVHIYFTNAKISGVNDNVYKIYETLNKQGHQVYFFALDEKPYLDNDYKYLNYFPKSHSKKESLWSKTIFYLNNFYNFQAQRKIDALLDEIKPDLVDIHTTWELSLSILKPIKKRKIPISFWLHDIGMFCSGTFSRGINYCNKCKNYNTLPCTINKCINNNFVKSFFFSCRNFFERYLMFKYVDLFMTVSNATKNYLINAGINKDKIQTLYNFVNKQEKNLVDYSLTEKSNYFLYAGGEDKIKGINTLIKAFELLPKNICLHVAGAGQYIEQKKYIEEKNITNIKILGPLNKQNLEQEYRNCISVIMPSEWFETFGKINSEAAMFGKSSISSNIGGIPEVVENNKTGLLFEPKNVEQLKLCILKYYNDRKLAVEHGKNARIKIMQQCDEKIWLRNLINIYDKIINNNYL